MSDRQLYKFGEFSLQADENALHQGGKAVPLTPKMFEMLRVLVENHGRTVDKDTLFKEVWPDSFVEEGNIAFNIRQLRKVLGDEAQAPSYIETVPKRGYRFIAAVETVAIPENGRHEKTDDSISQSVPKRRFLIPAIAGIVLLIGATVATAWLVRSNRNGSAPILSAPFAVEKLSTDGEVYHVVISPDGKNLVYTHRSGERQSLWLRQLETSTSTQIVPPSDHFYGGLAISPDGDTVYFVRGSQTGPSTDVYKMPVFGGVPEKIVEGTQGWISVSADGRKISYVRCPYTDDDYCSLYVADTADGGNEKKLVSRPRPIRIADNKISPDGKSVAFGTGQSRTASNEFNLMAVDIETGAERELTSQHFFITGYIAWLPDSSGLLITARTVSDPHGRIWKVSGATGEASVVTSDSESYSRLSLDEKGTVAVSTQVDADFHLNLFEVEKPEAPPLALASASNVGFAPNGKLIFGSAMSGNAEIWTIDADGGELRQLTNNQSGDTSPLVSPDNKFVFFGSDRTGNLQIWRMNSDGTEQTQITTEEGGPPLRVSPDGQWLYYRSGYHGSLRRVNVDGGKEELVLNEMGRGLVVSPDATLIAFSERKGEEITVTVYSIADRKPVRTFTAPQTAANLYHLTWSNEGDYLAYIITDDKRGNAKLYFQAIDGQAPPRQIADLKGDTTTEVLSLALSPDGKTFAVVKGNWKHDAVLIKGLK